MKHVLLVLALFCSAAVAPARADSADDAARESAERVSDQLDRAIEAANQRLALERSSRSGGLRVTKDGVLFVDGPEWSFEDMEWVDAIGRRGVRRPASTDTLIRVGPGMTLALSNLSGDIRVMTWDRNEVRVQADHDESDELVAEIRDGTVRLGVGSRRASPAEVDWTLTVPAYLPLELQGIESDIQVSGMRSSVRVQSMRGDVTVTSCQGPLEANSLEGEVHVSDVRGNVTAGSVNSVVRIVRVNGPVEAQTINGDIQLVKLVSPNVDASTVNGRVYFASGYQPHGRYMFSSHNGKLIVPVPDDQLVKFSMSSFQGQIQSSVPMPKQKPSPKATPHARSRGQHFRFVMEDGVAVPEAPEAPEAPTAPRAPGAHSPKPRRAPVAPEIELESFSGLIRLASVEEVDQVLAEQRSLLAARRAALDSARVYQMRARGELERARRYEQQMKSRGDRLRRSGAPSANAGTPAPKPETPPPPPPPRD